MSQEKQEFYNKGVLGCLLQGRKALDRNDNCVFKDDTGARCFLGHNQKALGLYAVDISHLPFSLRVGGRDVHDHVDVVNWPAAFRKLATEHGLSDAVVTEWEKEQNHD